MRRLAAVRGAGERKLFIAKTVTIGRPLFHEGQRLKDLDRRTRENRRRNVADGQHHFSRRVGKSDGGAVAALDQRSARHFDNNRISHIVIVNLGLDSPPGRN
jgi:hypothetical protein